MAEEGNLGELGRPSEQELPKASEYTRVDKIGMALHLPKCLGGGYFGPYRYLCRDTLRFLKCSLIARAAAVKRVPFCIVGTGLGPVTTKLGRWSVASVLKKSKGISLRDQESVDYGKELAPNKEIVVAADMVLAECTPIEKNKLREIRKVGVHFGPWIERTIEIDCLTKAIRRIMNNGAEVAFIVDCAPTSVNILSVPERITQELDGGVEIIQYTGVAGFLRTLDSLDMVLTSKLHVGIAAYAKGLFPVSIAAHIKTKRFYKQVGLQKFCFDLFDNGVEQAIKAISQIRENPALATELLAKKREIVKSLALENRIVLEAFLRKYVVAN